MGCGGAPAPAGLRNLTGEQRWRIRTSRLLQWKVPPASRDVRVRSLQPSREAPARAGSPGSRATRKCTHDLLESDGFQMTALKCSWFTAWWSVGAVAILACTECPRPTIRDIDWANVMSAIEWPGIPWNTAEGIRDWFILEPEQQHLLAEPDRLYISIEWRSSAGVMVLNLLKLSANGRSAAGVSSVVLTRTR